MALLNSVKFMLLLACLSVSLQHDHIVSDGHSLEYYLCQDGLHIENVRTLIVPAAVNHTIPTGSFCLIENLTNVTIKADSPSQQAVIICQQPWRGFGFFNTSHLRLSGLTFHQCGGEIEFTNSSTAERYTNDSNIYLGAHQKAVLLFSYCYNTSLSSVSIMGPYGGFGVIMVNAFGKTDIINLHIAYKLEVCLSLASPGFYNFTCRGSGLVFVYIKERDKELPKVSNNMVYVSGRTSIHNNLDKYHTFNSLKVCNHDQPRPIISGTALTVILANHTYKVQFSFTDFVEIYENYGEAAVRVEYCNSVNSTIEFRGLTVNNNAYIGLGSMATGVFTVIQYCTLQERSSNKLHIAESLFADNGEAFEQRQDEGSTMLVRAMLHSSTEFELVIENTTYQSNKVAIAGSNFYVKVEKVDYIVSLFQVKLHNITVIGHHSIPAVPHEHVSIAMFSFINVYKVEIVNGTFRNNYGSIVEAFGSIVHLAGSNKFIGNTAVRGGAISLSSSSLLMLHNQHSVFINNRALTFGGAIFIDGSIRENTCGFQINGSLGGIQLIFTNNTAGLSGNAVYVNNLYNCTMYTNSKLQSPNLLPDHYSKIFRVSPPDPLAIASFATCLSTCQAEANVIQRHSCTLGSSGLPYYPRPGQTFQLSISVHDSVGQPAYANVFVKVLDANKRKRVSTTVMLLNHKEEIYPIYRNMNNTLNFTLASTVPDAAATLQLVTDGEVQHNVYIGLLRCPIGFSITDTGVCDCSTLLTGLHDNSIKCDINTLTITLPASSWFGQLSEEGVEGFSLICPVNYCCAHCTFNATLPDAMCRHNRTGVLCGRCPSNMSLTFGSNQCAPLCSNYWLLTIVGYSVVGVVLVLVLFKLKLTISTGVLGGVIFFANMTVINEHDLCLADSLYVKPFTVFVSLLNLNLGFPLCFYSDMSMLAKIGLQFVFPVYLWLMVALMVVVSRYSTRVSNLIANQSVQVLATLVQLSFAKLLSTVTTIFVSADIRVSGSSSRSVWYYDGSVRYLEGTHLILFILCIIVSVGFILPYLVLSLGASWLRKIRKSYRIRPLIDAHHGPYKDNSGHWFGVRQLILALAYGLYAGLRGSRPLLLLSLQIISLMVFCIVQAHIRPFKNVLVGLLDLWLLVLLLSLNVATFMFIAGSDPQWGSPYILVMISLFLVTVVCVLLYQVAMTMQCSRVMILRFRGQSELYMRFDGYQSFKGYREPLLETI